MVPVPLCRADHERPLHLYHAGHLRPHDRGVSDDLHRADPPCHHDKPGLELHRAELPEIPVRPGVPGVSYHGVRGYLFGAGPGHCRGRGPFRGDLGLHGVHGASVFRIIQDRQPLKESVRGALRR